MAANIGGYEKKKFVTSSLHRYTCWICSKVLRDPIWCGGCKTLFCRSCIMHYQNPSNQICFACKNKLNVDARLNQCRRLKKEIDKLLVYCAYRDRGCQEIVELRHHHDHENNCNFAERYNCAHCGGTVTMRDFEQFRSTQELSYIS